MSCNETREELVEKMDELQDQIDGIETEKCSLEEEQSELKDRLDSINEKQSELDNELETLNDELCEAENQLKNLKDAPKPMRNGDYREFSGTIQIWFQLDGKWRLVDREGITTNIDENHHYFRDDLNSERKNIFDELKG